MKATEANLLGFLKKSPQFVIPIYQRTYSWTEKECRQLWDDVIRAGSDDSISVHFIGSIVYIEEGLSQVSHQAPLLVIDGQQRLTTAILLLAALAELVGNSEPLDGFSNKKIKNYYLVNPEEEEDRHYKLLLSQTDKESLMSIISKMPEPIEPSIRIKENYENFKKWISTVGEDLGEVCKGIAKLVVVDIALNRQQDNPQLIFESMNSTGRELSQADLIRNFILMGLESNLQRRLYEQYWRPMEKAFGQEAYSTHFDSFMRHYLTVKTGDIPRLGDVYEAFKNFARTGMIEEPGSETIVKDLREYADYYCSMALGTEVDSNLNQAFHDLSELKVDTAYPLLLELYNDYDREMLSQADFYSILRLIEAYVFRRAICAIPTNSLNKTFATFSRSIKKDRYLESAKAHFLKMKSYRRFPNDKEFVREIQTRDLYNFRTRSYWLRRFENFGRKERVTVDDYTIEHIMPQNENLSSVWQTEIGLEWERVHESYLHTLGNLTLTGYNSEYSDKPFKDKRDMKGGFSQSPLRVNEGLGQVEKWNEASIKERAQRLANSALEVWASPNLSQDILDEYQVNEVPITSYTIDNHQHLSGGLTRDLFEEFRREVKALDPCVSEEFLKRYIAFKAETNFVDVIPQASGLSLSINIPFTEITEPRGICRDVSERGHRGNGDVNVKLTDLKDLPYIVGLVRQALELQLGNEEAT